MSWGALMFWRKDHAELAELRKQAECGIQEREAARRDLQTSVRQLYGVLMELPLDDALRSLGNDLAGNPGKER